MVLFALPLEKWCWEVGNNKIVLTIIIVLCPKQLLGSRQLYTLLCPLIGEERAPFFPCHTE